MTLHIDRGAALKEDVALKKIGSYPNYIVKIRNRLIKWDSPALLGLAREINLKGTLFLQGRALKFFLLLLKMTIWKSLQGKSVLEILGIAIKVQGNHNQNYRMKSLIMQSIHPLYIWKSRHQIIISQESKIDKFMKISKAMSP